MTWTEQIDFWPAEAMLNDKRALYNVFTYTEATHYQKLAHIFQSTIYASWNSASGPHQYTFCPSI